MAAHDASAPSPPARSARILANRYRLVKLVGEGPEAAKWDAHDDVLDRPVAATVLHIDAADPEVDDEFRRAAAVAARLRHPHLVSTLDAGVDGATAFVIEEVLTAPTLRQVLAEGGAMRPARAAAVTADICAALEAVHSTGRAHRGLTTGTVVVCPAGTPSAGRAKVTDVAVPGWTSGIVPAARPSDGSPTGDLAAAGAILYELVTGTPPGSAVVPPRRLRAGVPKELEIMILRSLGAADPPFRDVSDLRHALLALDLGFDDAHPLAEADPTPPRGVPVSFRETERRWVAPAMLLLFIAGCLVVLAVTASRSDVAKRLLTPTEPPAAAVLPTVAARSFDPDGDGTEKEATANLAIDDDTTTAWSTERYRAPLPRLKRGVGLVVQLDAARAIERVRVTADSAGWNAEVYVSDVPHRELDGWGAPRGAVDDAPEDVGIEVDGARGSYVLVWFTDLGPDAARLEVAEVEVDGRP